MSAGSSLRAPRAGPHHPHFIIATWAISPPSAGRQAAVVKLGRIELTGFLGWLIWSVVHIYFLITARDRFIVAFTWLWDYVTFQRGA
jgi:NADH dehydrogenase FAD-containing subunit